MDGREHSREHLAQRREASRRRLRRRRRAAGMVALLVVTALSLSLLRMGGHTSGGQSAPKSVSLRPPASRLEPSRPPRPRRISTSKAEPPNHRIPILMYHAVEAPPPGARLPDLWVPADRFGREMLMLRSRGYHAITLRDAYDYWKGRRRVPRKPIVISFDDGFRSQYAVAMPVLRRLGWPGVLNLEVGALKGTGPDQITPGQVRALKGAGWEIDAHTINHLDLTKLPRDRVRYELVESRHQIARRFGVPVDFFCYPAGRFDAVAVAEVRRAGYLAATTTQPGLGSPRELFTLKRTRVGGTETPEALGRTLAAAAH